jgi:Cof subfamily protein (haloacid dehalogenase superfamily)
MIPLVVLDLDGTLIGSSGSVQECVWQAADTLHEAGVKLALCTGRPCEGMARKVAQRLGPDNPHVFQSGALLAYPDGKVLKAFSLREQNAKRLIGHARDLGFTLELYTPSTMFVERKTALSEAHAKMIGVTPIIRDLADVAENEPVVRAQWVISQEQLESALALKLEEVQVSLATSPALEDTFFVSLTQKDVSKGSGIRQLAAALRVKLGNIMAIGDSQGDVPMLEVVGHPVLMESAPAELKEKFPFVVGDVDDCGVTQAFEQALKLKTV